MPELKVINNGMLSGFVSINPRWAAFRAKDYIAASSSVVNSEQENFTNNQITVRGGDFDLRKYQVARSQFFEGSNIVSMTFSYKNITFSTECIRKIENASNVEMLINPNKKIFAVRKCHKTECRNAIKWANIKNKLYYPRIIAGSAFIPTLYEIMGWNRRYKYRLRGEVYTQDNQSVITFNMLETEIFISQDSQADIDKQQRLDKLNPFTNGPKKDIMAFPYDWASTFGNSYYRQAQIKEMAILNSKNGSITEEGIPYNTGDMPEVTSLSILQENIENIRREMTQTGVDDGE